MPPTNAIRAGRAFVELFADDSRLVRGLKRAQRKLRAFGTAVRGIGMKMAGLGAAITAPLIAASKVFADTGENLHLIARRTGSSVEALSELGFAAEQSGASLDVFHEGLTEMVQRLGEAKTGTGSAADGLRMIGLEAEKLSRMSPADAFMAISDAINALPNQSDRVFAIDEIFGGDGREMIGLIQRGSDGMGELMQQARRLGLTISSDAAASAAKFTDTLNILWKVIKRGVFAVGSALAPLLIDLVDRITTVAVRIGEWVRENKRLVVTAFKIGVAVLAAGAALVVFGTAIIGLSAVLGAVATALSTAAALIGALLSPIGLVVTAVGVLGAVLLKTTGTGAKALAWLGEKFEALKDIALRAWRGIADALAAGDMALAAKVLWQALKVQWLKGVNYLKGLWLGFKLNFMKVATNAFFGAVKIAANAWDGLRAAWVQTVAFLKNTWTSFTSTLASAHRKAVGFVTKQMLRLQGVMDENFDAEGAIEIAEQHTRSDLNAIERRKESSLADSEQQRQEDLARIGQENLDTLAALDQQAEAMNRQRRKEAQKAVDAAMQDLASARREYQKALDEAAKKRKAAQRDADEGPGSIDEFMDKLKGIGDRLGAAAQRTVEVRGTFNAAAIQGLMTSGGAAERTAEATEQTARHTKRIQRQTQNGGPRFT